MIFWLGVIASLLGAWIISQSQAVGKLGPCLLTGGLMLIVVAIR